MFFTSFQMRIRTFSTSLLRLMARLTISSRVATAAFIVTLVLLASTGETHANVGPNILPNSSLEGGNAGWNVTAPFQILNDVADAHTGAWTGQAVITSTKSYQRIYSQSVTVWSGTSYVTSIWVKGSGKVQMNVVNTGNYSNISSTTVTATSTWTQVNLTWNSGAATSVRVELYDSISGSASAGTVYFDDFQIGLSNGNDIQFLPSNPLASGFNLIFDDEFDSISTIDVNHTGADGYKWYVGQYYGSPTATSTMYSVSSGVLTITGCPVAWGSTLQSTEPDSSNGLGYHGTAFSTGSGIYYEARIAMANISTIDTTGHALCPAFWSNDIKGCTKLSRTMPGNPSDFEYIEDDFMEFDPKWGTGTGYSSTIHDWSGTLTGTVVNNVANTNSTLPVTTGTDFTQWHTYGVLWVPASAANGWIGYRQAFFDGVPQAAVCWQGNQTGTYPPSGSYMFSLEDEDKFDIILGACQGGTATMLVDYVHIYAVDSTASTTVTHNGLDPHVTSAATGTATSGTSYNYSITATNSPTGYNAVGLPTGLSVNTATGLISGTPSVSGTFNVTLFASNAKGAGSQNLALLVNPPPPVITSALQASAQVGVAFSYGITGSDNPTSFNATGLPGGLSVNKDTGIITGTPSATGTYSVSISATNVTGIGSAVLTLAVSPAPVTATPTLSESNVVSPVAFNVVINDTTSGAVIYYTTDGTTPTTASPSIAPGSSVLISKSCTLKANALATNCNLSQVVTGTYQVIGALAAGDTHTMAMDRTGTCSAWGANAGGQLGNNSYTQSNKPVAVTSGTNVVALSLGYYSSYLVKNDGSLWAWGNNYYGIIGDGTTTSQKVPKQIYISGMSGVAAGQYHAVALKSDGTVWTWGLNNSGQLGTGNTTQSLSPVQVPGLANVIAVAAGGSSSFALKADGTVWAWGSNNKGQLGDGSTAQRTSPVQVAGSLSNVVSITAGFYHAMALKSDGTAWAWGLNTSGQLGDGTTTQRNTPVQITALSNVVQIASGVTAYHSAAVKSDGTLWTWGINSSGQLGNNSTTQSNVPVQVTALNNVEQVAVGSYHTVASLGDGTVWSWGLNSSGQLGNNTTTSSLLPVQVFNNFLIAKTRAGQSAPWTRYMAWNDSSLRGFPLFGESRLDFFLGSNSAQIPFENN